MNSTPVRMAFHEFLIRLDSRRACYPEVKTQFRKFNSEHSTRSMAILLKDVTTPEVVEMLIEMNFCPVVDTTLNIIFGVEPERCIQLQQILYLYHVGLSAKDEPESHKLWTQKGHGYWLSRYQATHVLMVGRDYRPTADEESLFTRFDVVRR